MKREFLINISFLVFINLLIKPFYVFGVEARVQNVLGPEDYGLYFSLFNFCFLFQIVADLGIHSYNLRELSQNRKIFPHLLNNLVSLKILLGFLFLGVLMLMAIVLGYPKELYYLLLIIAINQILLSFLLYARSNLSGLGKYRVDSFLSVLDKLILIVLLLYLLINFQYEFQLEWFVYSQTIALGTVFLLALFINVYLARGFRPKISKDFISSHLRKSLPYALIIFLMTVYTKMDGVMLERLLDDNAREAGIYAAAFRIFDAGNMFAYLFAGLLFPMYAYLLSKKEPVAKLLQTGFKLLFAGSLIIIISCITYRDEIMLFLYPDHADPYYGILLIYLMLAFLALAAAYAFGSLLSANGNVGPLNKLFVIGVLLNFILNIWLIPKYQALGAAIATLITQYFVLIGQVVLCKIHFNISFDQMLFTRLIGLTLVIAILYFVLAQYVSSPWFYELIVGILISFLVSLLLRVIDIKEFKRMYS